ncbi:YqcC family protein [Utexia brackfieldae]|uniref:YqcC family protein n=1 Tax=Utexia brackfieldae TaxID=3074108 RepID=UPI00370DAAFC
MSNQQQQLRELLINIEIELQVLRLWDAMAPSMADLSSTQPFAIDTLMPHQWLQWIFLPRMHALLDAEANVPSNFSLAPYFEESLKESSTERLLDLIREMDALVKQ